MKVSNRSAEIVGLAMRTVMAGRLEAASLGLSRTARGLAEIVRGHEAPCREVPYGTARTQEPGTETQLRIPVLKSS
jgi:hypothetical protein